MSLGGLFVGARGQALGEEELARLESALQSTLLAARRAWPNVHLADADVVRYLAERLEPEEDGREALRELAVSDLYLTCAAERGDAQAVAAVDALIVAEGQRVLSRLSPDAGFTAEVLQQLRTKLWVGTTATHGKLRDYLGRGPLRGWLSVAVLRIGLSMLKERQKDAGASAERDDEWMDEIPGEDPELELIRTRFRKDFKACFQSAVAQLSSRDRNVLRLRLVDGLNIDEIGRIYSVHRASVARWIQRSRELVLEETKRGLAQGLKLSPESLDSLLRLIDDNLDLSLNRILAPD